MNATTIAAKGTVNTIAANDQTIDAIIDRLRPRLAKITGVTVYLQPAQDITVGGGRTLALTYQFGF